MGHNLESERMYILSIPKPNIIRAEIINNNELDENIKAISQSYLCRDSGAGRPE